MNRINLPMNQTFLPDITFLRVFSFTDFTVEIERKSSFSVLYTKWNMCGCVWLCGEAKGQPPMSILWLT